MNLSTLKHDPGVNVAFLIDFIIIIIIAGTQWHRTLSETKNKDSSL